jgi:hypothetical protein
MEVVMPQLDIRREFETVPVEPLLPIEKKLIGWSLATGIVLLIILTIINRYVPVGFW